MGVRGLQTYFENYSRACYTVKIEDIVNNARKCGNEEVVIAVDTSSILRFLYQGLSWVNGGQLKEFKERFLEFVNKFKNLGVTLVFFFDGYIVPRKIDEWKRRRINELKKIQSILDRLESGISSEYLEQENFHLLPFHLKNVTLLVLKNICHCQVICKFNECDQEIAKFCKERNCLAILGQDSDFAIFEVPCYYLSMKNLNLMTMVTTNYDRNRLAEELGISTRLLPLFSTLVGNDIISPEYLKEFHRKLTGVENARFQSLFLRIATFIKSLNHQNLLNHKTLVNILGPLIFSDPFKWNLIELSLESYSIDISQPEITDDSTWGRILKFTMDKAEAFGSCTFWSIMNDQVYSASTTLDDFKCKDIVLSRQVTKPLRQKLYGILLKEKPLEENCTNHFVEEMIAHDLHSVTAPPVKTEAIYPKVPHPGVLSLWNKDHAMDGVRWQLLLDALNVPQSQLSFLKCLPQRLIVPALALRYIYEAKCGIQKWELQVMLATSICLADFSAQQLALLPSNKVRTRGIRVYTVIMVTVGNIFTLFNALGLPLEMVAQDFYCDGKLFHSKYALGFCKAPLSSLCDKKDSNIVLFNEVNSFIENKV